MYLRIRPLVTDSGACPMRSKSSATRPSFMSSATADWTMSPHASTSRAIWTILRAPSSPLPPAPSPTRGCPSFGVSAPSPPGSARASTSRIRVYSSGLGSSRSHWDTNFSTLSRSAVSAWLRTLPGPSSACWESLLSIRTMELEIVCSLVEAAALTIFMTASTARV